MHNPLGKTRGRRAFSTAVVLTLALGLGATTAILGAARGVFRPLPYPQADRLVHIWAIWPGGSGNISFPDVTAIAGRSRAFESTAAYQAYGSVALTGRTPAQSLNPSFVTPSYFELLGARPAMGRLFAEAEDREGASSAVAVLSAGLWSREFAADPQVVGRTIQLNGLPFQVIGVLAEGFADLGAVEGPTPDVFMPTVMASGLMSQPPRTDPFRLYWGLGRLKPGVSLDVARRDLEGIARQMEQERPDSHRGYGLRGQSLSDRIRGGFETPALFLIACAVFILLVAGANVVNLFLLSLPDRRRELAVRSALGASAGHLSAMVFREALTLTLAGSALGALGGFLGSTLGAGWIAAHVSPLLDVSLDAFTATLVLSLSAAASLAIALASAILARRVGLREGLSQGGRTEVDGGGGLTRRLIMGAEVAFALLLLVGAGLTLRSYQRLAATPLGFETRDLLTFRMDLTGPRYQDASSRIRLVDAFLDRARTLPGVTSATVWGPSMLGNATWVLNVAPRGAPIDRPDAFTMLFRHSVNPGGVGALGIPLISGRDLSSQDTANAPLVGVLSESASRRLFPGLDPIGRQIVRSAPGMPPITVVGVARDARHRQRYSFQDVADAGYIGGLGPQNDIYLPYAQRPNSGVTFAIRVGERGAGGIAPGLREAAASLDPALPLTDVRFLEERIAEQERLPRALAALLAMSALLAGVLAASGIYGVVGRSVSRRTREIGLRVALGAGRTQIARLVAADGLKPVLAGAAVGLIFAVAMTRSLRAILFDVSASDPLILAGVTTALLMVALLGMAIPARRALGVDPCVALRSE